MLGTFRNSKLYIEVRPRCPKCKKEFMLDLKNYLPGKAHSCHACGTIAQYDSQIAENLQTLIIDLETQIQKVQESFQTCRVS